MKNKKIYILCVIILIIIIILLLRFCGNNTKKENVDTTSNIVNDVESNDLQDKGVMGATDTLDDTPLEIIKVEGITNKLTNEDVTVTFYTNRSNVLFSYDNGKNWSMNNKYTFSSNVKLNVLAKTVDEEYNTSKLIEIKNIDKIKPSVSVTGLIATEKEIIVQATGKDNITKNLLFNINNGKYTTDNKFTITKKGTYTFTSKDEAGNVSQEIIIEIKEDSFKKETTSNTKSTSVPPKIYYKPPTVNSNSNSNSDESQVSQTKVISAKFDFNGASQSNITLSCITTSDSCTIITPSIVRNNWEVLGWSNNSNDTSAKIKENSELVLTEDSTYYAISKRVLTGTFHKVGTNDDGDIVNSCTIYNKQSSCRIDVPTYNKSGAFNVCWSYTLDGNPVSTFKSNTTVLINNLVELYVSFKHPYYYNSKNLYQERNLNITKSLTIGKSLFEYEEGIPLNKIEEHRAFMNEAYSKMPWLFVPGKTFVMTYETFDKVSMAYGVTYYSGEYYFIDLKYDSKGDVVKNAIDDNATIHELAHAWDSYYGYRMNTSRISSQSDIKAFYNSLTPDKRNNLSIVEWFAGATTEYYWHYLGMNPNKPSYAGYKSKLTEEEQKEFVNLLEKYINISKNGYKK